METAVVYADIFFLVNFSMDFASLLAAGQILSGKLSLPRVTAAACAGGVYAVLSLLFPGSSLLSLLIDFAVGLLLCFIAFGFRSPGRFFAAGGLFFGVSLLTGGAVTALYGFLTAGGLLSPGRGSAGVLLPTAFLTAGGALLLSRIFRRETARRCAQIRIFAGSDSLSLSALVDSGQLAREPFSGLPGVIVSGYGAEKLLPKEMIPALALFGQDRVPVLPEGLSLKAPRLLPVRTLRGEGMLPGLLLEISVEKGVRQRVCVAFDLENTAPGAYGGFDCILPGCLLPRGAGRRADRANGARSQQR